jgi:hypothetical protein
VRYKNWKIYYNMTASGAAGWAEPLIAFHMPMVQNIKRDPFEQGIAAVGDSKTLAAVQGALGGPVSAYMYDWNMLPIGQLLWEKELMSYKTFPPLQAPEVYNLDGMLKAIQAANNHPSE